MGILAEPLTKELWTRYLSSLIYEELSPHGPACYKTCQHSVIKTDRGKVDIDEINLNRAQDAERVCV